MSSRIIQGIVAAGVLTLVANTAHGEDDRSGFYTSIAGLWVMQEDSDVNVEGISAIDAEAEFDDSLGIAAALGYDLPALPIRFELEYSYRNTEAEHLTISGTGGQLAFDADLGSHTLMANTLVDIAIPSTPLSVYAGVGMGVTLSTIDVASIAGVPIDESDDEVTMAYQARAGLSVKVMEKMHVFGGVRWFEAMDPEFDDFEFENASLNIEFGLRLYF